MSMMHHCCKLAIVHATHIQSCNHITRIAKISFVWPTFVEVAVFVQMSTMWRTNIFSRNWNFLRRGISLNTSRNAPMKFYNRSEELCTLEKKQL